MNMSGTSMVAFGFAALLGVTGFAYLDARNQFNQTTDRVVNLQSERDGLKQQTDSLQSERDGLKQQADSLQSERDKLNKQIKSLQSELSTRNNRISALEGQLDKSRIAISAYERQIKTISVCLQGIAEGNNQLKQGNQAGAIITFSSVASQCREADTILEQQNSSGSRQEQPDTNVGSVL